MPEIPKIVLPHGGYKKLIVHRKSDVVYEGTVLFCRRFLPAHGDRTVDQMTQTARSCKQNIAEGSSASGTSKETEIKLTSPLPSRRRLSRRKSLTFARRLSGRLGVFGARRAGCEQF